MRFKKTEEMDVAKMELRLRKSKLYP